MYLYFTVYITPRDSDNFCFKLWHFHPHRCPWPFRYSEVGKVEGCVYKYWTQTRQFWTLCDVRWSEQDLRNSTEYSFFISLIKTLSKIYAILQNISFSISLIYSPRARSTQFYRIFLFYILDLYPEEHLRNSTEQSFFLYPWTLDPEEDRRNSTEYSFFISLI